MIFKFFFLFPLIKLDNHKVNYFDYIIKFYNRESHLKIHTICR